MTTYACRRYLDIYCPPARKFDLVQLGYRIETRWQIIRMASGADHRVGVYVLEASCIRSPELAHTNKSSPSQEGTGERGPLLETS